MNNLDDLSFIKSLDKSNMLGSIELLGEQIKQTWEEVNTLSIASEYANVNRIVFSGMGGSSLGAYVAKHLYTNDLRQSFEIVNDYTLPGYVDENTLVVVGSYSGTTEETISGLHEAHKREAKIITIATGGVLEEFSTTNNVPFYKLMPKYNPSSQPRMGIGYSVFALLTILSKLKFIQITDRDIDELITSLKQNNELYGPSIPAANNQAKELASKLFNKLPIFIAGEFLVGAIHAMRNQLNENAKSLAIYFPVPEMNHHLLEALRFPEDLKQRDFYILFQSSLYSPKIKKRIDISHQVIEQNGHQAILIDRNQENKLIQVMTTINFGSYVGFYLAILYGIDPSPIFWVEEFKKKLSA